MKERKAELQKLIDFKKLKGANRKPRYATRKLSIGLVSCMLGFVLLVSPQSVEASEVASETPATSEVEPSKEKVEPVKEEVKEEAPVAEENKEIVNKTEAEGLGVGPKAEPIALKAAGIPAETPAE